MLRFLRDYRGRATSEKFFRMGDEVDVPYLDRVYLVENDIAEEMDTGPDLDELTVDELREMAREQDVPRYYEMRKAELVEALR